jgi:hypothetical protein
MPVAPPPDDPMKSAEKHESQWIVESLGETTATVEVDGKAMMKVPRWLLPGDAKEKDVLAVTRAAEGDRVSLKVERDAGATRAALDASAKQLRDAPVDKKGGDVTL